MSTAESVQRTKHVGLVTQQRRLRHLRSLSARNIIVERSETDEEALMETYFTLHLTPTSDGFYTSEKIQDSLNPTWRSFDLQKSGMIVDPSRSCFIVRVWGGRQGDYKLIIEWMVNLKGLCYLGEHIHKDGLRYQPNTVIFGMFEGFYSSADNIADTVKTVDDDFKEFIEVEQNSAFLCYSIYSLGRLHTTQRAISQTKASESKVRCAITEKLKLAEGKTKLHSDRETLLLKVGLLSEELKQRQHLLVAEAKICQKERVKVQNAAEQITENTNQLKKECDQLKEDKKFLHEKREQCRKLHNQFGIRKTTLISELSDIYPIIEISKNHEHSILGIKLPNAENYSGSDDTSTATALGHTCHLILMIARFIQLPLRYPMLHCGSRSIVRDHITEQLADRDRDFPLYSRGKERFQFNYAVYLLNRNIAQLRFALGLHTSDLRMTLPNLKSLLETKWGVKISNPSVLQVDPAVVSQPQLPSSQSSEEAIPTGVPPYPSQYSETLSGAAEVATLEDDNIPHSPPPSYHVSEQQSANIVTDTSIGVVTHEGTDVSIGTGTSIRNNPNVADSAIVTSNDTFIGTHLQPVQYGDNHSIATEERFATHSLDGHNFKGEAHVENGVSSVNKEAGCEQIENNLPQSNRTLYHDQYDVFTSDSSRKLSVKQNRTRNSAVHDIRTPVNISDNTYTQSDNTHPLSVKTGPLFDNTHPPAHNTQPLSDNTHPVSDNTHPLSDNTHPLSDNTHPQSDNTHPLSVKTGPLFDNTHPPAHNTQPLSDNTHPVSDNTQPPAHNTQPLSDNTHPVSDNIHPLSDNTHPLSDNTHPLSKSTHPLSNSTHPLSDNTHPLSDNTHPLSDSTHPLSNNTHPLSNKPPPLLDGIDIPLPKSTQCSKQDLSNNPSDSNIHENTGSAHQNENHHNHNLHINNNEAVTEGTVPVASEVPSGSTVTSNSSNENTPSASHEPHSSGGSSVGLYNRENARLREGNTEYAGAEDPVEVQRIMDSFGTLDGMFQFDELGSRTDALDDMGTSFSNFRKPSTNN